MTFPLQTLSRRVVPTALSTGIGLVQAGAKIARTLPERAGTLPVTAMQGVAKARQLLTDREAVPSLGDAISRVREVLPLPGSTPGQAAESAAEAVEAVTDPFSLPEPVAELVEEAAPGATLSHDELPLVDYDHLTIGSLRARIRRLDAPALIQLRDYERAHANRLPVLMAFENRLKAIAAETPGAEQATLVDA
jgi:hypothetical protein